MCQEYSSEDDDFIEIEAEERENIEDDEIYQTFELRENIQHLYQNTTPLLAKGFIEKITNQSVEKEILGLQKEYQKLYKIQLTESTKIEEYGTNEFFGGKAEAFQEAIEIIKKYKM